MDFGHGAQGICLLGAGRSGYLADILQDGAAFCIQTHLDTGDYTDPRALEGGQGSAAAPRSSP